MDINMKIVIGSKRSHVNTDNSIIQEKETGSYGERPLHVFVSEWAGYA